MDFLSRKRYDYKASAITACTFLVYVRETSIMSTRIAFSPMARAGRVKSSDNDNRAKALFRSRSTGNNERRIVDPSRPSQADPFFFIPSVTLDLCSHSIAKIPQSRDLAFLVL